MINRRQVLTALALALPGTQLLAAGDHASPYSRQAYEQALASGKPFMLDFYASWWGTCRAQERTVSALIDSNPEYRKVTILRVDWDEYGRDSLITELSIPRRSTLVMFNQGVEVGRVVAQVSSEAIEALFKAVL